MPININDITFVDISELAEVEQLEGVEEIQVSESHKINLKNLISNFLTTQDFAQALTQYYTKAQTYTKTEVHNLLSSLNAGVDLKLESYIKDTELTTTLQDYITSTVYNNFVNQINTELSKKVTAVPNQRLITEQEANKLASAVTSGDLEPYSLKNTGELEEVVEIPKEENTYIKFFDETEGLEKKISMTNLILDASNFIYPTYKTLEGIQNGSNAQFKYRGTLIQETAELYIGGLLYPVNIGFAFEGDTIVITGAPIPTAEDVMRLKAIYLT